jgi:hypothetical protein
MREMAHFTLEAMESSTCASNVSRILRVCDTIIVRTLFRAMWRIQKGPSFPYRGTGMHPQMRGLTARLPGWEAESTSCALREKNTDKTHVNLANMPNAHHQKAGCSLWFCKLQQSYLSLLGDFTPMLGWAGCRGSYSPRAIRPSHLQAFRTSLGTLMPELIPRILG